MTQGRGFIALAAVLFGNWKLGRVIFAATFFAVIEALGLRLQAIGVGVPPEALHMLPYVLTVVVLAGIIGRSRPPARFALPYIRGESR
jgi:simple sugar transport system permease protein